MKYEKFDIERALAGEPVILRNGLKAYIRHKEDKFEIKYPLTGVILREASPHTIGESWQLHGPVRSSGKADGYDIIGMYLDESIRHPLLLSGSLRYGQCIVIQVPYGIYSNIFNCRSSELVSDCGYNAAYGAHK